MYIKSPNTILTHLAVCCQELHAHLNGSISNGTMQKLIDTMGGIVDGKQRDVWSTVIRKGEHRTLDE